jgi:ankyrin repeat protein
MLVKYTKELIKLIKDEYMNKSNKYTNYDILQWAAEKGYLDIVKLVLNTGLVDPSNCDNLAISLAAENGHDDIVGILLQDKRVESEPDFYNTAIENAIKKLESKNRNLLFLDQFLYI